ncbi:MAG: hypothetical protein EOP53_11590 [Sphingobacteriales bacterium]|nr:MAG: hypothetical protein EOP53_11590 [Sphingobacteriales bacterium]
MQNLTSAVSEIELNGASPIAFMNRLNAVIGVLNWKFVDTEFETIEIVVPRNDMASHGEFYIELDDEKALLRYHIPLNNDEDVSAELKDTVSLFEQQYRALDTTEHNISYKVI